MNAGSEKVEFDVLVIGAGVIGLSIARRLSRQGIERVGVVERGRAGREASYAAAGMLAPDTESGRDRVFFDFCSRSLALFPRFADELLTETGIDVELDLSGTLEVFTGPHDLGSGRDRLCAADVSQLEPQLSDEITGGIFYPGNGQVESRRLLAALVRYAQISGIELIENCRVDSLTRFDADKWRVDSERGSMTASHVVLATGAWTSFININDQPLALNVQPVKGQMIAFNPQRRLMKKVIFGPECYVVPRRDGRILVGATVEDVGFENSVTSDAIDALRSAAVRIIPALADEPITDKWAGLRPAAPDALPVIGPVPGASGLSVATAHFRNGILLAPLTAAFVADAICGNAWPASPYGPERFIAADAAAA